MNNASAERPKKVIPWALFLLLGALGVILVVSFMRNAPAGRQNGDDLIAASSAIMRHPIRSLAFAIATPLGLWAIHHGFLGGGFGRRKAKVWATAVIGAALVVAGLAAFNGIR